MAEDELTDCDRKLFEYIRAGDFQTTPWSTPEAARATGLEERQVYESLSNLAKHLKGRIYIYYKDGGLRIQAE
ncbi:MAG: hypothetical protein FJ149_05505 [Euryarchaeota archaeon]|nr:hypothetical protein [Euryarchaeota archaeon]